MNAAMLVLALAAAPEELAVQLKARLLKDVVQQGTFEQSKQVKGFKRPLKSSGTYRVAKGEGVDWNTLKPFPSQLKVRAGDITSRQGEVEVFKLDAKTEPTVRVITELLFSLLCGDLDALSALFTASGELRADDWSIELSPKTDGLKKIFSRISLRGDTAVRSVHLMELSGDATLIQLTPTAP